MTQYKYWMVHACDGGATNKQYQTFDEASVEAKRLATTNPGKRFGVMELVLCYELMQPEPMVVKIV